jgi:hypothetical protein
VTSPVGHLPVIPFLRTWQLSSIVHNAWVMIHLDKPQLVIWPQPPPMSTGAPCPAVHSDGHYLLCAYFINSSGAHVDSVALLKFESVLHYRFGYPNDEALQGHSLYQFGLKPYSFFKVENSPLIAEIEKQNEFHAQHRPGIYAKFCHWVVTFHDEMLEVIALQGSVGGHTQLSPEKAVYTR